MKKYILFFGIILASLSIMAFISFDKIDANTDLDLVYKVDSRFMATVTKSQLDEATSVLDLVPKVATHWWKMDFKKISVSIVDSQGNDEAQSVGYSKTLSPAQIMLLRSVDYSTDFYIKARGTEIHPATGQIEEYVYYFSVIPEREASYEKGEKAFVQYIRDGLKEYTADITLDRLRPGQVEFTVSTDGTIKGIQLLSSSGYKTIDNTLAQLIKDMPNTWVPARDYKGERVEQKLVFFFGLEGC